MIRTQWEVEPRPRKELSNQENRWAEACLVSDPKAQSCLGMVG